MMRIYRVAQREYLENVKTKGFWIGILLFPVMIWLMVEVPKFLEEKGIPTRHVAIVSRDAEAGELARQRLTLLNRQKVLQALQQHIAEATESQRQEMLEEQEIDAAALLDRLEEGLEQMSQGSAEINPFNPKQLIDIGDLIPDEYLINDGQWLAMRNLLLNQLPEDAPEFVEPDPRFMEVGLLPGLTDQATDAEIETALRPYLRAEKPYPASGRNVDLFALVLIPETVLSDREPIRFWSSNLADTDLLDAITDSLTDRVRQMEYDSRGISSAEVAEIAQVRVRSTNFNPNKQEGEEKVGIRDKIRQYAPVGFVYLLWIAIFTVAQMLLNNTIEEKSNRIIEVLLSSVTTNELLLGKVLGVAAVGVTMQLAWIASLLGILKLKAGPGAEWVVDLLAAVVSPELLIGFIFYFVTGYLFYAFLFAGIGSICNTIKEAQNFMSPMMLILMVPLGTMVFIPNDPNGTIATVMSWVPPWTPFIMMNRMAASPPMGEIVGTGVMLLISVVVVFWMSAKVFRIGVLRTGQPPKFMELLGWLKSSRP
jgi:ABC-2 type transport system permease protein